MFASQFMEAMLYMAEESRTFPPLEYRETVSIEVFTTGNSEILDYSFEFYNPITGEHEVIYSNAPVKRNVIACCSNMRVETRLVEGVFMYVCPVTGAISYVPGHAYLRICANCGARHD